MAHSYNQVSSYPGRKLSRHDFPSDFVWGVATSNYQIEGAYKEKGKSLNNWDVFSVQRPEKIVGGTNGCIAIDHYNRVEEDVATMKRLGIDSYRFSLSWSRILPAGRLSGGVNREGVRFYNHLINLLISQGITPNVTLFHFEVPQCLMDEYGGFLSSKIVKDFAEYADVCYFEFGDRVKFWATMNEPWVVTHHGYAVGTFPPARGTKSCQPLDHQPARPRCPRGVDLTCHGGDAGTEPYIVGHNLLLAHAHAVDIYRRKYQAVQDGKIGLVNMTTWFEPYTNKQADIDAAARALDFSWGWFTAPIVTGDYPPVMRQRVKERLPKFTPEESNLLKGSYDFIGLNYYTTNYISYKPHTGKPTYIGDQEIDFHTEDPNGIPIGEQAGSSWLFHVPYGIYKLLRHNKDTYNDPIIYITENGTNEVNDPSLTITKALEDDHRISYYTEHLGYVKKAMDEGVKVRGYYPWSLFDNYEWAEGYSVRFGLFYVDYVKDLARYPKKSAIWYMNFLNKKVILEHKRLADDIDENAAAKKRKGR